METGAPASSMAPMPIKELLMWEGFEAGDPDDQSSQMSEESTDQNPAHDLHLNEDKLLGMVTDLSVPGGHSDDSIALVIHPGEDDLVTTCTQSTCRTVWESGLEWIGSGSFEPTPQTSYNGFDRFLYFSLC